MKATGLSLLFLAAALAAPFGLKAANGDRQPVRAELISEVESIQAGTPFTVALRLEMDPNWHTYWKNPGDAGLPTELEWTLPAGFQAGEIQWAVPEIFELGGLINYGYEKEVLHLVAITPPDGLSPGDQVLLSAHAFWLMCEEVCIPARADLNLVLPVGEDGPSWHEGLRLTFEESRRRLPQSSDLWRVEGSLKDDQVTLVIQSTGTRRGSPDDLYFFSEDGQVDPNAPQPLRQLDDRFELILSRAPFTQWGTSLPGVLYNVRGWFADGSVKGLLVNPSIVSLPVGSMAVTSGGPVEGVDDTSRRALPVILLFALAGGFILNLMPCVFPVLSLKVLSFVDLAGESRRVVILHGLFYTLGILLSFWGLALLLNLLRAGGEELGWGFQLQSPGFVFALAILLFAFALNLSGLFEVGTSLTSIGGSLSRLSGLQGSLFAGILATVVATPCAAPFLGTALGTALTLDLGESFIVFTFIGLGLSLPYLLLSLFPGLMTLLPAAGPWMESLKQFLAFPLYATVGFLLWVLAGQVDGDLLLNILLAMVLLAVAGWIYGRWALVGGSTRRRRIIQIMAAAIALYGIYLGWPPTDADSLRWETWSPERVEQLRDEGVPIYVDFTARWCATCQTNKKVVFSSKEVLRAFSSKNVVALRADWTNHDPRIAKALAAHGRSAIPFNLLYLPGQPDPVLFPVILTPGSVLQALNRI